MSTTGLFETIEQVLSTTNKGLASYEKDWESLITAVRNNDLTEVKKHLVHWSKSVVDVKGGHGAVAIELAAEYGHKGYDCIFAPRRCADAYLRK